MTGFLGTGVPKEVPVVPEVRLPKEVPVVLEVLLPKEVPLDPKGVFIPFSSFSTPSKRS
jgi:hypothetical protein